MRCCCTTGMQPWPRVRPWISLTVSRVQEDVFDLQDVALSLPTIVGSDGVGEVIAPDLDDTELAALGHSAEVLHKATAAVAREQ